MRPEGKLINALADRTIKRIIRKTIFDLGQFNASGVFEDDRCLKNLWDELCVEARQGPSPLRDPFDFELGRFLEYNVGKLDDIERAAVWLQTVDGSDWICNNWDNSKSGEIPWGIDDIVAYFKSELWSKALNCANKRVDQYLNPWS